MPHDALLPQLLHLFHHGAHVFELLQQLVHVLNADARPGGDAESAKTKRPQARQGGERAFREDEQRSPFGGLRQCIDIRQAVIDGKAFDEDDAKSHQQRADEGCAQFALGDKAHRPVEHGHQQQRIEITGMVGDQHAAHWR